MKPKPSPFPAGQREKPMAPPAWWRRLAALREPAKKLRHNRIWGFWERRTLAERFEKQGAVVPYRVKTVYPSWAAVCHPVRHRRSGRGRVKMRSYRSASSA